MKPKAAGKGHPGGKHPGKVDFSQAPFLAIWETTQSCALACRHCRAEAILGRHPGELSTEEGKRLIESAARMKTPIFILSGGDPFNRPDLEELIAHGKKSGLRMGTIPAATSNMTLERMQRVKEAGCDQLAFSIDGPAAALHDDFRGIPGAFEKTLEGIRIAHEVGLPLQVNTTFAAWNFQYLDQLVELVRGLGVVFWEVFFLIPMGRGKSVESITAEQFEIVFERLHRLNEEESFIIKLTEAPHYRRFVIHKERAAASSAEEAGKRIKHILARPRGVKGSLGMSPQAVNAGKGFVFIDHFGAVFPSGFLPISVGNVRQTPLPELYRESPLFQDLRDPKKLKGKCGACEFAGICAGSRARAYAVTGDPFASDPFCAYVPPGCDGD